MKKQKTNKLIKSPRLVIHSILDGISRYVMVNDVLSSNRVMDLIYGSNDVFWNRIDRIKDFPNESDINLMLTLLVNKIFTIGNLKSESFLCFMCERSTGISILEDQLIEIPKDQLECEQFLLKERIKNVLVITLQLQTLSKVDCREIQLGYEQKYYNNTITLKKIFINMISLYDDRRPLLPYEDFIYLNQIKTIASVLPEMNQLSPIIDETWKDYFTQTVQRNFLIKLIKQRVKDEL